jgi:hypothetical protein
MARSRRYAGHTALAVKEDRHGRTNGEHNRAFGPGPEAPKHMYPQAPGPGEGFEPAPGVIVRRAHPHYREEQKTVPSSPNPPRPHPIPTEPTYAYDHRRRNTVTV